MALLSLITEKSTFPGFPTILVFLWGHFGVDKNKSGDHFGVGIISGAVQYFCVSKALRLVFTNDRVVIRSVE